MSWLTPYQKSLLGKTASSIIKNSVLAGKRLATIQKLLQDKRFNLREATVSALRDFWMAAKNALKKIFGSKSTKPLSEINVPNISNKSGTYRFEYDINTIDEDGEDRIFGNVVIDLPSSTPLNEAIDAMYMHFINTIGIYYDLKFIEVIPRVVYNP